MSALKQRKTVLLAGIEAVAGVAEALTGAHAMQIQNPSISPMRAEKIDDNVIKGYFGKAPTYMTQINSMVSFEIPLAGHGGLVVGAMPKVDALLQACGCAGTQQTRALAITRVDDVATAVLENHGFAEEDLVSISGAAEGDYNGTVQVLEVIDEDTFTYAVANNPATPATGAPVVKTSYTYKPITDGIKTVTMFYFIDGVLHKMKGARGNVTGGFNVKNLPVLRFEFIGVRIAEVDQANPVPDLSAFTIPLVVNTGNTPAFSMFGFAGFLESFEFNFNNQVVYETLVGKEEVEITDRQVSGNISIEAVKVATKNFWAIAEAQETDELTITHGTRNGNKVTVTCPKVMIDSPDYKDLNGKKMLTMGVSIMPDAGNDEIEIKFH